MGEKLFAKPYLYFWLSIPILIGFGFLNGDSTFLINFKNTYFVIENSILVLILSIAFGIIGFWYWLMCKLNRKLIQWMTIVHVIITIDGIIIAFLIEHFLKGQGLGFMSIKTVTLITAIVVILIFAVQVIFPLNLILSFFNKTE